MEKMMALMLDCSRNAVTNIKTVKKHIDLLEKMGYTSLMLYTEDTYEIMDEPYFGYLRGRYSKEELKELDAYALKHNIELIPCIQTLAHLNSIFKWNQYSDILDIDDILLIDEPKTYELIEKMFKTLAECFSSRKVNIGQDEAHNMGLGAYLSKHGYQDKKEFYLRHLNKVINIASKYNFHAYIWADMFYKMASKEFNYYSFKLKDIESVKKLAPKNVTLIYWDYYHTDKKTYDKMIINHKKFDNNIAFAGGVWNWMGFVPLTTMALKTIKPSMASCNQHNINEIIMTAWKDNGAECSSYTILPALFYAKKLKEGITDLKEIKKDFYQLFNISFDDFKKFELVNKVKRNDKNIMINPSKYMLYNDPFLGIYDTKITPGESTIYKKYANMYQRLKKKMPGYEYLCDFYAKLSRLLYYKYELGLNTREAYLSNDETKLNNVINQYSKCINALTKFIQSFKNVWMIENKPHGFDIQDIRLGGVMQRLISCKERLINYKNKKIAVIEELEEKLLPFDGIENKETYCLNNYQYDVSVNKL